MVKMNDNFYLGAVILLCLFSSSCGCQESAVVAKIFQNYNKILRPVKDQNTITNIEFELRVFNIISVNEPQESINLLLYTTALWYDEYITWNRSDFGGCISVKYRASELWTPDLYFTNAVHMETLAPPEIEYLYVTSEGLVRLHVKYNVELACPMTIRNFPLDTQVCSIDVGLLTFNYSEAVLQLRYPVNGLEPPNDDPNYAPVMMNASEFETVSFRAEDVILQVGHQTFNEIHYKLGLKRRPEYYFYVIIIPSFLLTTLCIIGIFTPNSNINERNERVTLGLTTLLSMAVILNIVTDQMPKGSEGLPLLGLFVLYEIGMCSFAIILSTCIIILHQRAHSRGWKPAKLCLWIACGKLGKGLNNISPATVVNKEDSLYVTDKSETDKGINNEKSAQKFSNIPPVIYRKLKATLENINYRLRSDEEREHNESIWQRFCDHVDIVLLVILLILNAIGTSIIFM